MLKEKIEKAIPEPILIKREMLESYSNACLSRAKFLKTKKGKYYKNWQFWIMDLLGWLEIKIDFNKKEFKYLKKLQDFMNNPNGTKMTYGDWSKCWYALRLKVETLGITKIEMAEEDLATAFLR